MCLAFVAIEQHPDYPLLLLFNRDESYSRAALAAHWWNDGDIFGGRDMLKGGTWAAISRSGRFALLTFIRAPRESIVPSIARGEIVPRWVLGSESITTFLDALRAESEKCLGFNLIFGDRSGVHHFNNRSGNSEQLSAGIHGVSNGDLHDEWFKVSRGKERLEGILKCSSAVHEEMCLELLADQTLAPDAQVQETGLGFEREKGKSGIFVNLATYGTLTSSVVRFSTEGAVCAVENSFSQDATETSQSRETFFLKAGTA